MIVTKSLNKERVVRCPVDGCDYEGVSRGMHLHVLQSAGNGHGPNRDIPEHLNFDELEVVGERDVEMDYPEEREVENTARLCPFCGHAFKGYQGVKIHLGQKQGKGVHPESAVEDTSVEDCPVAEVDEDMNVINVVEENSLMPSTKRRIEGADTIPIETVQEYIQELEDDGLAEQAERARSTLLP